MTAFLIVAMLFLGGAMLMLLPSLLQSAGAAASAAQASLALHEDQRRELRDDAATGLVPSDRLAQSEAEIERRAAEDAGADERPQHAGPARRTAIALLLLLPLASISTYLHLGRPQAVAPTASAVPAGPGHTMTEAQIVERVAALAERLRADPGNAEGWVMLGRSYTALGRYRDGAGALQRAVALVPGNAGLLADLADVTAMAQGRRLAGEPAQLIQRALDADPKHPKSLALAGSVAFEARDYDAARSYWQRLMAVLPPGSDMQRSVQSSLDEATQLASAGAAPIAASGSSANDAGRVRGTVRITAALAAKVQPGDTLFVFARAAQGARIPLAVWRVPVGALPREFVLDDSMAMSPQLRLSGAAQVVVGARISRSGNATPQAGDLVGVSAAVAPGTSGVEVVIDGTQP